MAQKPNIDMARASALMDVVAKVTTVAPTYTSLIGIAMEELKEMNKAAQEYIIALGKERQAAEQKAAADLAEQNRIAAENQARLDAQTAARTEASRNQPPSVVPGQPVPDAVRLKAGDADFEPSPEDRNMDGIADQQQGGPDPMPHDDTPVTRRV